MRGYEGGREGVWKCVKVFGDIVSFHIIVLSHHEGDWVKQSRHSTARRRRTPHADVRGGEVVEQPRGREGGGA